MPDLLQSPVARPGRSAASIPASHSREESSPSVGSVGRHGFDISPPTAALVFLALLAVSLYPLFSHAFVSINDFVNHLTRIWVDLHYQELPALHTYFAPYWHFQPNLALDSVVSVLGHFVPVYFGGKIFLALTFALILGGTVLLHRAAFGRWSAWPFLAALLLYNRNLLGGHVTYLFGIGLYLITVSGWIRLRQHSLALRTAMLAVLVIVMFSAHLFALGLLGLTIGGYELYIWWKTRTSWSEAAINFTCIGLAFIPAVMLYVFLTPHSGSSFEAYYRSLTTRITAFGAPLLYSSWADGLTIILVAVLCLVLIARGALRIDWGLATGAVLLVAAQLVMPNILATTTSVDHRAPIAIMLLLVAATDAEVTSHRLKFVYLTVLLALLLVRVWTIDQRWTQDDAVYADVQAGLATLPPNSVVASAFPDTAFDDMSARAIGVYYLPAWDVIQRGGFTQTLFAYPTQHPMMMRSQFDALHRELSAYTIWENFVANPSAPQSGEMAPLLKAALARCDYIAFVDNKPFLVHPTDILTEFYSSTFVKIYRVQRSLLQ